jgi:hypothetical protein
LVGSSKNNKLLVCIISSASFTFVCSPQAIHVYPGTVFLVSHEADFYEEIVDRVIDIEELVK